MSSERQLFLSHLAQTSDMPLLLEITDAKGIYITGKNGKKYIDFISGISVSSIGHNNPEVKIAIKNQVDKHLHLMVYGEYVQSPQVRLAEKLAALLPSQLSSSYFVNSGAEANEGAIKLAKRYTGKPNIITFKDAYHGSTNGALSLMGNETFKNAFRPLLPGVKICDTDSNETINAIDEKTAAVIIEPIRGESGIRKPDISFMQQLRKKCNQTGTLLIFDEIQTGFGRTGKLFGFEHFGIIPDIITFAKAMGGGMPLGAFVSSKKIMECLMSKPFLGHITTFGGHPVSCAASLAAIEFTIKNQLTEKAAQNESVLRNCLKHDKIKELRGIGLFMAMELESFDEVKKVIKYSLEKGLITDWFLFCDNSIRIAPPLIITEEEIKKACGIIIEALDTL